MKKFFQISTSLLALNFSTGLFCTVAEELSVISLSFDCIGMEKRFSSLKNLGADGFLRLIKSLRADSFELKILNSKDFKEAFENAFEVSLDDLPTDDEGIKKSLLGALL